MTTIADRLAYMASQSARVAYYAGQYAVSRRAALRSVSEEERQYRPKGKFPRKGGLRRAMRDLFVTDWKNVEAGIYPPPSPLPGRPLEPLARTRAFLSDLPKVTERRRARAHSEVMADAAAAGYPRYYLQNFHYQTGGWLTEESAKLYDHQVEVLFTGTADAMRRQGIVPLKQRFGAQRRPRPEILDVGTGTGRFPAFLKAALPHARITASDPSPAYLAEAARNAPFARRVKAFAEDLPFSDAGFDAVTSVFLFHELPPKVRAQAAAEIARMVKPDGLYVMVDALQWGDVEDFDGLLEMFPRRFHEPYFDSYLHSDFAALFAPHGLVQTHSAPAFLSKVYVFEKTE